MKTESTLYFDGQFWVGVIERHEADRVRAVRVMFGAQPSDAEFYEFLLAHANALLCRLDEAAWASNMAQRQARACLIVCVSVFCLKGLMHDE